MFPYNERLHAAKAIRNVVRRGVSKRINQGVRVHFIKSQQTRVAIIVSKQFSKKAVQRNRQRRVLTQALRDVLDKKTQKYNIVVTDKSRSEMLSYTQAKDLFEQVFSENP